MKIMAVSGVFGALVLALMSVTFSSAPNEFIGQDLKVVPAIAVVLSCLSLILFVVLSKISLFGKTIALVFLSCAALVFVLSLYLLLSSQFLSQATTIKLLICGMIGFTLFIAFKLVSENGKVGFALIGGLILFTALKIFGATQLLQVGEDSPDRNQKGVEIENLLSVKFVNKPNVYFLSFDGLAPKALIKKHLGLTSTAYFRVLDQEFVGFDNFFADHVPTKRSLNSLLAFDESYYSTLPEGVNAGLFSGQTYSPLLELFRTNGYEVTTGFWNKYFGSHKGPWVDKYLSGPVLGGSSICEFVSGKLKSWVYLGYCGDALNEILFTYGIKKENNHSRSKNIDFETINTRNESFVQELIAKSIEGRKSGKPQFQFAYIYSPGSTTKGYRADAHFEWFKNRFAENSVKTASYLNTFVTYIKEQDPNALVFVFGDHGPYLSRHLTEGETFITQDRHGIYGGVLKSGACAEVVSGYKKGTSSENVTTLRKATNLLIGCLSGGQSFYKSEPEFVTPNGKDFRAFKYE